MGIPADREEMSREIESRLGVRRRFYRAAFLLYTVVVLAIMLPTAWLNPDISLEVLAAAASAIFGTGVVLWWAYLVRKSAMYEKAGRTLLEGGR